LAVEALDAHRDQLLTKPEIAVLLRSITGLAYDLLMQDSRTNTGSRYMAKSNGSGVLVHCFNIPAHSEDLRTSTRYCSRCRGLMDVCLRCAGEHFYVEREFWNTVICGTCEEMG
jgi:hypothetical protein